MSEQKKDYLGIAKKIIGKLGSTYIANQSDDPKFLEELLTGYLKQSLKSIRPVDFKKSFEIHEELIVSIDLGQLEAYKSMLDPDDPNIDKIKENIRMQIPHFNKTWVLKFLEKDEPDFYAIITQHPKKEEFESWITQQIQDIASLISKYL